MTLSREEALRKIVRLCERGFQCKGTAAKDVTLKAIAEIADSQLGPEPSEPCLNETALREKQNN